MTATAIAEQSPVHWRHWRNAGVAVKLTSSDAPLPLLWRLHSDLLFSVIAWMNAAMEPEDRREPIFELSEKFKFLKENAISRGHCGHAANESSFCDKLAIPRMTFLGSVKAGRLTSTQQQALADKCKFPLNWPEWNDPNAERTTKREDRRDTWEAFKARYLEHHSKEEPKSTPAPTILVPLKEDLWAETLDGGTELASLSLRTGQSEPVRVK